MRSNSEKLRAWREIHDLTQEVAAAKIGVPQGTYAAWELGKKCPDRTNAPKVEELTDGVVKATDWPPRRRPKRES